jgi:membrane protein DedA with SNARE-associated domain
MLTVFLAGMIVGAILFWKISKWWGKSSIKKASDAVGSVAKGPTQVAKGLLQKAKDLFEKATQSKDDKEDE